MKPTELTVPIHDPWKCLGDTFVGQFLGITEDAEERPWALWYAMESRLYIATPCPNSLGNALEDVQVGAYVTVHLEEVRPRFFLVDPYPAPYEETAVPEPEADKEDGDAGSGQLH